MRRAAQAGDILLEIGRPRGRLIIFIVAAGIVSLGVGITSIIQVIADSNTEAVTQLRHISDALFYLSLGICLLFWGLSKGAIRESGIIVYSQLLKWDKIESFQWVKNKPTTLALSVKRRFPWGRTVYVRFPSDKQKAATEILERNLSANETFRE